MKIRYPDYNNSIVILSCSIRNHFGLVCNHATLSGLDELLKKDYKNVVVMLFDGMGVDALEHNLPKNSFLRKHLVSGISSVFPSTTTAATTSIESGLSPIEHSWIGWSLYFEEIDEIVEVFKNTIKDSGGLRAADDHVARKYMPYKGIVNAINETGNVIAYEVSPFGKYYVDDHRKIYDTVKELCKKEGKKYIYTYWDNPDLIMHETGCYSKQTKTVIKEINDRVEDMCKDLEDTLIIITADHGHTNVTYKFICDYPNLLDALIRPTSIESRAIAFFIKEGYKDQFITEFHNIFGDDFLLLTKEEVLEKGLLGEGLQHLKISDVLGDFLAIAISDVCIANSHESNQFISNHAGLTEKEMLVPFIAIG